MKTAVVSEYMPFDEATCKFDFSAKHHYVYDEDLSYCSTVPGKNVQLSKYFCRIDRRGRRSTESTVHTGKLSIEKRNNPTFSDETKRRE